MERSPEQETMRPGFDPVPQLKHIRTVIRERRVALGLKPRDLVKRVGWRPSLRTYEDFERGLVDFRVGTLLRVAFALDLSWEDLCLGTPGSPEAAMLREALKRPGLAESFLAFVGMITAPSPSARDGCSVSTP